MKTNLDWLEVGEGCGEGRGAVAPESEGGKRVVGVF